MKFYQEYSNAFRILSKGRVVLDVFAKGVRSATAISAVAASALMADVTPTALPDHPTIINGNINIQTNTANMVVNQSTNQGIINWGNFNIGSSASVHFNQPNASSSTLNRVVGNELSTIAGNLSATGNIILINPNGVIFSNGSRVDVGGIIASTMNLSNENYLNNTLHFTRDGNAGTITNIGTIRAQDAGYVALLAPEVLNEGVIIAQKGSVVFASGDAVTLSADNAGLLNVTVDSATVNTLIENRGLVEASGGVVYMSAKAASDALSATVSNSGTIQASSMVERGGKIVLLGTEITNSGTIEAKGATGGGEILIGGDYQGTNAGIYHQATTTTLTSTSIIDASATDNGDGGKVVVWSDITNSNSVTTAQGTILAKGGINGGNGGNIETSGHVLKTDGLSGSAAAVKGNAGTWLFDPTNVIIGSSGSSASGNNDGTSMLTASSIASLLNGGTSVTVTTYSGGSDLGDLTVNSAITKSSGNNDVTLTLRAANSIVINSDITNTGGNGKLNLTFDADNNTNAATSTTLRDGGGIVILGANLSTGGGNLTFGGTTSNGFTGGDLYIGGGSNAISLTTSGGALDVKGQLIIATSNASGVTFSTSGGNITLGGSVDSGNTYTAVSGTWTWDQAKTNAATVANSYLATITTRLENALAIRAAGYNAAWLGGQRIAGTNLWEWVTDPAYNSSTNPMIFFYQGSTTQTQLGGSSSGAGGTTATGYYANWDGWTNGVASGEPNNWNGSAPGTFANTYESALQFTGSLGKWNDLSQTSYNLSQYVRETNLSPSKLTLNAGSGSVIINGAVGASKALSSLDVTSSSTQVNGSAIITTGAQNYSSSLTVNTSSSNPMPDVTLQGTGLTANGAITVYGGNINVNTNLTSTALNQDILLKGVNKITQAASTTIQTNSGDITLWSNTGNVTSGVGDFGIDLQSGTTINSSGGNITLGGGLDNGSGLPTGYAYNGGSSWSSGIRIGSPTANATTVNLLSSGGNISVKGQGGSFTHGIIAQSNFKIDSGTGTISMDGVSDGAWGIGLSHAWGTTDPNYAIVSSHTGGTAITINGTSTSGYGVVLGYSNANQIHYGNGLIQSSGANGGITVTALTASAANEGLLTMNGTGGNIQTNIQLLSAGGDISITSSGSRAAFYGNTYFGSGMNATAIQGVTPLSSSTANLSLTFNNYLFDRTSQISTTGSLTIQPTSGNTFNINGNNTPVNWVGTMSGNDFVIASGGGAASTNFLAPYNSTMTIKNIGSMTGLTIGNASNTTAININSAISIAGPISLYGGAITLNQNLTTTSLGSDVLLKTSGNITLAASKSIVTNGGDITLWSNTDDNGGYIYINDGVTLDSRTSIDRGNSAISTANGGGAINLGGGSASATLASGTVVPTGYALENSSALAGGIELGTYGGSHNANISLYSGGGDVTVRGKSTSAYSTESNGIVAFEGLKVDTGTTGNIMIDGQGGSGSASYSGGIYLGFHGTNNQASTLLRTGNGNITLTGTGSSATNNRGVILNGGTSQQITVESTGTGTVTLTGSGATQDNILFSSNILAASGAITITGTSAGSLLTDLALNTIGFKSGSHVTESTSNITLTDDSFSFASGKGLQLNTTGTVTVQSYSNSFSSALTWPMSDLALSSSISGLTIGKNTNTADITIANTTSIAGPISIYGGNIAINAGLISSGSGANALITLKASGNVTDGANGYVSTSNLLLAGGAVTLDNASNAIATLAASGVSSLTYSDSNALTIDTVGSTDGITATGAVSIATKTGDLTVSKNVSGTSVTFNAGLDIAAGTSSGGNIILSNSPTLTASSGAVQLYTGSITGSTGVTTLVGSGSGNFRYNADETTNFATGSWTNLGSTGTYAIYREQPTANITNMTLNMTYGDAALPSVSATGTVNGDVSSYTITSAQYSSTNNLKANDSGYTIASNLTGLGYNVTGVSSGTLTVNTKSLSVTGLTIADKTYNGSDAASTSASGSLNGVLSGNSTTDDVGFSTVATFNNKNVEATKTVNLDYTLNGTDAANYTLADAIGVTTSAKINAATVTLSATKTYDGITSLTNFVTINTGVGSETLSYSGATANSSHVVEASYIDAITLADGTNGGIASNYVLPTLNSTNAPVTITAATLTPTISNTGLTKVYDGTNNAPIGFTPTYTFTGLASGDTAAALGFTGAVYDHADATGGSAATKITVSGLSISGITGNKSSWASDYVLDATSKDVSATITKAALTVTANNDSRFYSETDTTSYAGVRYNGFVHGESNSVLGGTLAIARSDASNGNAGTYTLTPSGLTSNNYTITNVTGTYTIIPANQLQIIVIDKSATYGDALTYSITSAKYLASDNSTINTLPITDNGNNSFTVDGMTFTISPAGTVTTSTAGNIQAGSYQLGSSSVTGTSSNFSNTIVTTGALSIAQKSLTPTASGVSKVYDGTTAMTGVTIGFSSAPLSNDVVSVSGLGAFDNKNVGNANKNYTISNLALSGADAANYYLSGGSSFIGTDGTITQKSITAITSITASDKTYNGSDTATLSTAGAGFTGIIGGDTLSVATSTGTFSDKNVGMGKTVSVTGLTLGGADASNYTLTTAGQSASTTASISRLNSVTWIGGTTGNWFDPANWAGGAVPDLSNVANVVIPSNVTVTFDTTGAVSPADASQAVNITGIGTSGSLTQTNGTLNIGSGGMSLNTYTQNGGTLSNTGTTTLTSYNQTSGSFSGTGNFSTANFSQTGGTTALTNSFNVSNDFSQGTSGSVTVGGNTSITDTTGGTTIGNLSTTGTTNITSTGGAITQDSGTSIVSGGTTTLDASNGATKYDITLDGNNNFQSTVNANGNNITLKDTTGGIALGNVTAEGTLDVTSTNGAITQTSDTTIVVGGTTTLEASNGAIPATYYDINLNGANNDFQSSVNATGRNVTLNDINDLAAILNASGTSSLTSGGILNVSGTTQNLTATSSGATTFGTTTVHGNLTSNSGGDVTQSGALSVDGTATVNAPGHNIDLSNANNDFNTFGGNASSIILRDLNSITLENITTTGNFSLNSGGSIAQTSGSTLNIGALTTLIALNDINLPNLNNHFDGLVDIDSQSAAIGSNERIQTGTIHTVSPLKILGALNQNSFIPPYVNEIIAQPTAPGTTSPSSTTQSPSSDIFAQPTSGTSTLSSNGTEATVPASTAQQSVENTSGSSMSNTIQSADKVSFDGLVVGATHTGSPIKAIVVQGDASSPTPVTLLVTIKAGEGFSFALPMPTVNQVAQSIAPNESAVAPKIAGISLSDGNPLPSWMNFDSKTMEFTSTNVPVGGLPLTVNVAISQNGIIKTIEVVLKNGNAS